MHEATVVDRPVTGRYLRLPSRSPRIPAYRRRPLKTCRVCGCAYDDAGRVCCDCAWAGHKDVEVRR